MKKYGGEAEGWNYKWTRENVVIGTYVHYVVIILHVYTYANTLNNTCQICADYIYQLYLNKDV